MPKKNRKTKKRKSKKTKDKKFHWSWLILGILFVTVLEITWPTLFPKPLRQTMLRSEEKQSLDIRSTLTPRLTDTEDKQGHDIESESDSEPFSFTAPLEKSERYLKFGRQLNFSFALTAAFQAPLARRCSVQLDATYSDISHCPKQADSKFDPRKGPIDKLLYDFAGPDTFIWRISGANGYFSARPNITAASFDWATCTYKFPKVDIPSGDYEIQAWHRHTDYRGNDVGKYGSSSVNLDMLLVAHEEITTLELNRKVNEWHTPEAVANLSSGRAAIYSQEDTRPFMRPSHTTFITCPNDIISANTLSLHKGLTANPGMIVTPLQYSDSIKQDNAPTCSIFSDFDRMSIGAYIRDVDGVNRKCSLLAAAFARTTAGPKVLQSDCDNLDRYELQMRPIDDLHPVNPYCIEPAPPNRLEVLKALAGKRILIWGDSFARFHYNGLVRFLNTDNVTWHFPFKTLPPKWMTTCPEVDIGSQACFSNGLVIMHHRDNFVKRVKLAFLNRADMVILHTGAHYMTPDIYKHGFLRTIQGDANRLADGVTAWLNQTLPPPGGDKRVFIFSSLCSQPNQMGTFERPLVRWANLRSADRYTILHWVYEQALKRVSPPIRYLDYQRLTMAIPHLSLDRTHYAGYAIKAAVHNTFLKLMDSVGAL